MQIGKVTNERINRKVTFQAFVTSIPHRHLYHFGIEYAKFTYLNGWFWAPAASMAQNRKTVKVLTIFRVRFKLQALVKMIKKADTRKDVPG